MENRSPVGKERRNLFRVVYPEEFRPIITIRGTQFKVIDICETGIRIANSERIKMPGDIFQASLVLHDNEPVTIVGRVIRNEDDQVAIIMTLRGIPYRKIISEQAFLRHQGEE